MKRIIKSKLDLESLGLIYVPEEKKLYKWVTEKFFDNDGELHIKKVQRAVNQTITKNGYIAFVQRIRGQTIFFLQHNLEWMYAHPTREIPSGCVICHIDKNKLNNDPSNLQAVSFGENFKQNRPVQKECSKWLSSPEAVKKREATKALRRLQKANKE